MSTIVYFSDQIIFFLQHAVSKGQGKKAPSFSSWVLQSKVSLPRSRPSANLSHVRCFLVQRSIEPKLFLHVAAIKKIFFGVRVVHVVQTFCLKQTFGLFMPK
jgi:hypothetical protein